MITVNSTNRGAAKKLLTLLGHPATDARNMTVGQLATNIQAAINAGLITKEGAQHALGIAPEKRDNSAAEEDGNVTRPEDTDDTDNSGGGESGGDGDDGESESDTESENDADSDGNESESKGEGESDDGDESDDDESGDGDPDADSDSDSDSGDSDDGDDSDSDSGDGDSDDESESESDDDDESESDNESESDDESESEDEGDDDSEIEHEMLATVLKYVSAGLNVALVGPAGTGKSYMARQVAAKLEKDFYVNGAMMSKYDLIGFVDAGGVYHGTPAYQAFTTGGVHCFDELDASAPDAVVSFNGMTDDQPFYTFPNGQHNQHEDYVAIACMNTYGNGATADYVGRYKQDAASMSRFVKVYIGYDARVESRCGSKDIVTRVQAVRRACDSLSIRHIVSTRMIIQAEAARGAKATKREIDRDIIFAGLDDDAIAQVKAAIAREKREAS